MKTDEIKEILDKVSPWPWCSDRASHICDAEANCVLWYDHLKNDASGWNSHLIANAPSIISQLVREVEVAMEVLNELQRKARSSATASSITNPQFYFAEIEKIAQEALAAIERIESGE